MAVDTTGLRDVLDTIRDFAIALTVTRPGNEDVVNGYVVRSSAAVAGVEGHMQLMSDKELRYQPEGTNLLERHNIWSLAELRNGDRVTDGTAPTITVDRVKYWKEGPFWHAQGALVDDDEALPPSVYEGVGEALLPSPAGAGTGTHT